MNYFERFKQRMKISGNSIRNEKLQNNRDLLYEIFTDDLSYTDDVYFWQLNKSVEDIILAPSINIRLYDRKFSAANGTTMKFQTLHTEPIVIGDILYVNSRNEFWICTESFNIDEIHYQGKLTQCNWVLKWQNKQGVILSYPCYVINATQYNSGETFGKTFAVGSTQHQITLPSDENTILIKTPLRFYLDKNINNPTPYVVTHNDNVTYNYGEKGLVKITVAQDVQINHDDRPDLGICNYKEFVYDSNEDVDLDTNTDNENENNYFTNIDYQTLVIKSGGNKQIYTAKFYDNQHNETNVPVPSWKIISDFTDKLDIDIDNEQISISIDNDEYIDEEFKLILTDQNGIAPSCSVIIKIESLL